MVADLIFNFLVFLQTVLTEKLRIKEILQTPNYVSGSSKARGYSRTNTGNHKVTLGVERSNRQSSGALIVSGPTHHQEIFIS